MEFRNIQNTKIIFKMYFDDTYLIYNMKTSPILGSKKEIRQNSLYTIKKLVITLLNTGNGHFSRT